LLTFAEIISLKNKLPY